VIVRKSQAKLAYLHVGMYICSMNMDAQTTKDRIIELGRDLMQTIGYHSFNYKQVATQLDIKNASIHHYFPSKEDLALAVIRQDQEDFKALIQSVSHKTPTQKLEALIYNYTEYFKNGKKLCVISTFGTSFNDVSLEIQKATEEYGALVNDWLKSVFTEGRKTGDFTFKGKIEEITALWRATLPGSLMVGRMHGKNYFDFIIRHLKKSLREV